MGEQNEMSHGTPSHSAPPIPYPAAGVQSHHVQDVQPQASQLLASFLFFFFHVLLSDQNGDLSNLQINTQGGRSSEGPLKPSFPCTVEMQFILIPNVIQT